MWAGQRASRGTEGDRNGCPVHAYRECAVRGPAPEHPPSRPDASPRAVGDGHRAGCSTVPTLHIAQDDAADELLSRDPLALLIGMLLDQQFPMERAFGAPRLLADRLGVATLSAAQLAESDPAVLQQHFQGPPALHRYPGSMATRAQDLARVLVERY